MVFDWNSVTIPVYPEINDLPSPPTETKAGNGSHLIDRFNAFIYGVAEETSRIEQIASIAYGRIINESRYRWYEIYPETELTNMGEKRYLYGDIQGYTEYTVIFPAPQSYNCSITLFNGSNINLKIILPQSFYQNQNIEALYLDANSNKLVEFVYYGGVIGWFSTNPTAVRVVLPT